MVGAGGDNTNGEELGEGLVEAKKGARTRGGKAYFQRIFIESVVR